ncbi:hypothetical protein HZA99_06060 [Candidatus Woesearchaeota archaeon]|nr:hypothetical protein [Candidatus Woesearchaeota archaeon]
MINKIIITFDEIAKNDILDFLDKSVNDEGYIVEKKDPEQKVLTFDGEEISSEEFGGAKKGSEVFIKSDLISLMRFSKN